MVEVVVVVSLEMEVDMAVWSCDAFLVLVAGECALGERLRKEVSFRRLLWRDRCSSDKKLRKWDNVRRKVMGGKFS